MTNTGGTTTPTSISRARGAKVALSGAGGQLGRFLRPALLGQGINLRSAGGSRPLAPAHSDEDLTYGDLRDPANVDRLLVGVDRAVQRSRMTVSESRFLMPARPAR